MNQRQVAAVILAAGRSRRMGAANKLLSEYRGRPLLLHAVDTVGSLKLDQVVIVTGYESEAVRACLGQRSAAFVQARDFAVGISASIAAGVRALPEEMDAVLICLGDMPGLRAEDLSKLVEAYRSSGADPIVVPQYDGRRGNPVLWPRRFFPALLALEGDRGAKELLEQHARDVQRVSIDHPGVLRDVDTPEDLGA